ncbi:AcrR family transcriptional regulator [Devosia sp. UYZn731]|uniref:TetR/AcrR family transcriptional regulator n=1 Tax=Devosia sp. UYZn731 TaxID=3156345 RepID=UPI0033914979
MPIDHDATRLAIARLAARLFLANGVAATSGKDIAAAAGVSERTVWRHFRTKESCVEPLLSQSALRFTQHMLGWSRLISIEDHLSEVFALDRQSESDIQDGILIVRLVAILPKEPDLQATWLMASHLGERGLVDIIAARLDRSPDDFDIRLCAATVSAAMRVVDEDISLAAIERGEVFTLADVVSRMARAIRAASTLPFCDPLPLRKPNQSAPDPTQIRP